MFLIDFSITIDIYFELNKLSGCYRIKTHELISSQFEVYHAECQHDVVLKLYCPILRHKLWHKMILYLELNYFKQSEHGIIILYEDAKY